ncbi:MAG: hypothetical protein JO161_05325, partial [Planctomycetaceae bacterium]|nr:hypothetical protein [Planctomycetaceae bacterium]
NPPAQAVQGPLLARQGPRGKIDLVRLEEVLNDLGRQGWVVEAMSTPQLKEFSGHSKEKFVIIL